MIRDKLRENEQYIEMLKMENKRWQDESNEYALKCKTYETRLEQKTNEMRDMITSKDVGFR